MGNCFQNRIEMQKSMIAAAIAATAYGAPLDVEVPVYEPANDQGYFAGLKEGIFLPIEEHALRVTNCTRPHKPHMLKNYYIQQAMSYWPMAKEMLTLQNNGVEPQFIAALEEVVERMTIILAFGLGTYRETAYCYGAVYAYEMKAVLVKIVEELMAYLPKDMIPDINELPPVKMLCQFLGLEKLALPEMPPMPEIKKEDLHPMLQSAYDSLF